MMEPAFDRTYGWESWTTEVYASDLMPDYTFYAENSAPDHSTAFMEVDENWVTDATHNPRNASATYDGHSHQPWQHTPGTEHSGSRSVWSSQNPQADMITAVFPDATRLHKSDPPQTHDVERRKPRCEGDLYTALWIQGKGVERAGWCGYCFTWHKLKDSAFVSVRLDSPRRCQETDSSRVRTTTCKFTMEGQGRI